MPQYVGVNLLVQGSRIKRSCLLPPLRTSTCMGPKRRGMVKEKETEAKTSLPKLSDRTDSLLKIFRTSASHFPPESSVSIPVETFTLHLPVAVNRSIHLPVGAHSHPLFLRPRIEVSKVSSTKVQPCTSKTHQDSSLPLLVTSSKAIQANSQEYL